MTPAEAKSVVSTVIAAFPAQPWPEITIQLWERELRESARKRPAITGALSLKAARILGRTYAEPRPVRQADLWGAIEAELARRGTILRMRADEQAQKALPARTERGEDYARCALAVQAWARAEQRAGRAPSEADCAARFELEVRAAREREATR